MAVSKRCSGCLKGGYRKGCFKEDIDIDVDIDVDIDRYFGCLEGAPESVPGTVSWYRSSCGTDFDISEIAGPVNWEPCFNRRYPEPELTEDNTRTRRPQDPTPTLQAVGHSCVFWIAVRQLEIKFHNPAIIVFGVYTKKYIYIYLHIMVIVVKFLNSNQVLAGFGLVTRLHGLLARGLRAGA